MGKFNNMFCAILDNRWITIDNVTDGIFYLKLHVLLCMLSSIAKNQICNNYPIFI